MVCVVCVACLLIDSTVSLCVAARCVRLLCSFILPCSFSPIHVDASALCEVALALKRLYLRVDRNSTHKALACIFSLPNLEKLVLVLSSAVEVSCAYSPSKYAVMWH